MSDPVPIPGGWLIKTVGPYDIQVRVLMSCARIVAQHQDDPPDTPSAYWCYYGATKTASAVLAAQAWDGRPDTVPAGSQRAYDGRQRVHPVPS